RRRHTRSKRDWSSDVCSSDLDQAFPAFVHDLHERGLLETTLVVALGEFGRTPKMGQFTQSNNTQKTGRDHWPHAFTVLLAGGGRSEERRVGKECRSGWAAHPW